MKKEADQTGFKGTRSGPNRLVGLDMFVLGREKKMACPMQSTYLSHCRTPGQVVLLPPHDGPNRKLWWQMNFALIIRADYGGN